MPSYRTPEVQYPMVYLEDTDQPLPRKLDQRLRYSLFKNIARGGTCIISSCKDLHLQRIVCYKTLRKELANDPAEQRRFTREARVTAMLQHPNTIPTYELGRDAEGHVYFTMKLVHGQTYRQVLDRCMEASAHAIDGFSVERLINILAQVGHALQYAHSHGVVHRDVKPENILVGPFGEVLLLDWGLAKVWPKHPPPEDSEKPKNRLTMATPYSDDDVDLTKRNPFKGTPAYLSPEQILNRNDVDLRSDIYSLGSILYETLALRRMNPGETVAEVLEILDGGELPEFEESPLVRSDMEGLKLAYTKSVARELSERYSSIDLMLNDLEQWLLERPRE